MRNIHELIGIIKGISFDGIINQKEYNRLQAWADKNRNFTYNEQQADLIRLVDQVVEDGVIDADEKQLLLNTVDGFSDEEHDLSSHIYELNGIIEGIICDDVINEDEVYHLKQWMENNENRVRHHEPSKELCAVIDGILEDGVVTKEEQEFLLSVLKEQIKTAQFETKLQYLRQKVKAKENIGIDLITLLDNADAMNEIHRMAEKQLLSALSSYSSTYVKDPEIVFISLVLIGMLNYDASYYDSVAEQYKTLYARYNEPKIEGFIRHLLQRYKTPGMKQTGRNSYIQAALTNALVPSYYLPGFFEFIYDIYKTNFNFGLSNDLEKDFAFIYDGLRTAMLSQGDDIEISVSKNVYGLKDVKEIENNVSRKTYRLISSTKQLILDEDQIGAMIKLSIIIIKLIDKKIWNEKVRILNPYLKQGYDKWVSTLAVDPEFKLIGNHAKELRSRWEPKFELINNKVYLIPPIHKILATYDYRSIHAAVFCGSREIFKTSRPYIREIIGGYEIYIDPVEIQDPLNSVRYILYSGKDVIYTSRDKLQRDFIVFSNDGKEIKNNSDFEGTAVVCHRKTEAGLRNYMVKSKYILSSVNVKLGDRITIDDSSFRFASLERPGIIGEEYTNHYLSRRNTQERIPVYKKIDWIVFETTEEDPRIMIVVNGEESRLYKYRHSMCINHGVYHYNVDLDIKKPDIYDISVFEFVDGKKRKLISALIALDPGLDIETTAIDEENYLIMIESQLSDYEIEAEINISDLNEESILLWHKSIPYLFHIPFDFDIYRIGDRPWCPMKRDIWIDDIKQDSYLDFYGDEITDIQILTSTGKLIEETPEIKNMGVFQRMPVGFLLSYKAAYQYIVILFLKNGSKKKQLFCYNSCVINKSITNIEFFSEIRKLSVTIGYYGKGKVFFTVEDYNNNILYKSGFLNNGDTIVTNEFPSSHSYTVYVYQKPRGLNIKKETLIYKHTDKFLVPDDCIGKAFPIAEVNYYSRNIRNRMAMKTMQFPSTYVRFVKKGKKGHYEGFIYARVRDKVYRLKNVYPIDIDICGKFKEGMVEIAISKDGKGLLLDVENNTIKDTLYDRYAPNIYSYIMSTKGIL